MKHPKPEVPSEGPLSRRPYTRQLSALLAVPFALAPALSAQEEELEEVHELSPFVVDASEDQGYRAENTLAGSRMNMSLEDVAQSVNVLTAEFLEDVGAENIDDILLYAVNAEPDYADGVSGLVDENSVGDTLAFAANGLQKMRGSKASVSVDNNSGGGTIDTYNSSRVEISQGPNAVLFGFGGSGGIVNLSTQQASTTQDSLSLSSTVGSFNQFRNILNVNKSIFENRLGFKVISLLDDADSWRAGQTKSSQRNTFIATWRPFQGTEVHANYEKGHVDSVYGLRGSLTDRYMSFSNAFLDGSYHDTYSSEAAYSEFNAVGGAVRGATGIQLGRNARSKVFIDNLDFAAAGLPTDAGNVIPFLHMPRTTAEVGGRMFSNEEIDVSAFNAYGDDATREENIQNFKIGLTQRLRPNLYLNLEYWDSDVDATQTSANARSVVIDADPNQVWGAVSPGSVFAADENGDSYANPFAPTEDSFWMYSDSETTKATYYVENRTFRGSLGYKLDTERWGKHRVNLSFNNKLKSNGREAYHESIDVRTAIEEGVDLGRYHLIANYMNVRNRVTRRHYYQAGPDGYPIDDTHISVGDLTEPVSMLVEDGNGDPLLLGSMWAPAGLGNFRTTENKSSGGSLTVSSKFLKDRLTTTFGVRKTDVTTNIYPGVYANAAVIKDEDGNVVYNEDGSPALIDEAARDLLYFYPETEALVEAGLAGQLAPNNQSLGYTRTEAEQSKTSSANNGSLGIVYKATKWASLVYNESDNRSDPSIFRTILPGVIAPSGDGFGRDIGLRFKLLDNKVSVNVNYFENEQNNSMAGGGINSYILNPHRYVLNAFRDVQDGFEYYQLDENGMEILDENGEPIVDEERSVAPIAESDPRYISDEEYEVLNATGVNQTLVDRSSSGYDIRIIANPTRNWRLSFNFSDMLKSNMTGLYEEDLGWRDEKSALMRDLYEQYVAAGDGTAEALVDALNSGGAYSNYILEEDEIRYKNLIEAGDYEAADALMASLHPVGRVYDWSDQETSIDKMMVEEVSTGSSKKKGNMFTTYTFKDGRFRGMSLGGGFTWRDKRILNHFYNYVNEDGSVYTTTRPNAELGEYDSITQYLSEDDFRLNLMAKYSTKMKLGQRDAQVSFQLNVNNVLEPEHRMIPLRYMVDGNVRKYTTITPRTWKLTTTVKF